MTGRLRQWGLSGAAVLVLLALAYVLWRALAVLTAVLIPVATGS